MQNKYIDPWTVLYGFVLFLFDWFNVFMMHWFVENRNFRFKKDYNNALTHQLMIFKLFNYFTPLCYVAFIKRNFMSLFTLNITMLIFGELKAKIKNYFIPLIIDFYTRVWCDPNGCKERAETIFT